MTITVKFSTNDAGDDSIEIKGADDGATTIAVTVHCETGNGLAVTRQASFSPPEVNILASEDDDDGAGVLPH